MRMGWLAKAAGFIVLSAAPLLVAIPAVAFFNFFQRIIKARLGQAETLAHELLAYLRAEKVPDARADKSAVPAE